MPATNGAKVLIGAENETGQWSCLRAFHKKRMGFCNKPAEEHGIRPMKNLGAEIATDGVIGAVSKDGRSREQRKSAERYPVTNCSKGSGNKEQ